MMSLASFQLVSADRFTIEQLVSLYNQTRVDYLIPMPMNARRLQEYITAYDVSLKDSLVAVHEDGEVLGLGMLGIRPGRAWITRLGVLPTTRRKGIGEALMIGLLENAYRLGIGFIMLEVIKNNLPAYRLFHKLGFQEVQELLVLRRSPINQVTDPVVANAERLESDAALTLLRRRRNLYPWTNQNETFFNIEGVSGLRVTLADDSEGWLVYQRQQFTLTRFAFLTERGHPKAIGHAFLSHLHHQYPRLDTLVENIPLQDAHLPAFFEMGYIEAFRRIEMWLSTPSGQTDATTRQLTWLQET
ncbi:MAG: GNAT family N-acetyltransferase [Anaerolineales bacterium]|nr:GNAT family N-acetyltransferase [Anaerolineales bacterium]